MHLTKEEFLARFPAAQQALEKQKSALHQLQFKIPEEIYQALRRDAKRQGRSMAGLVKHILAHRYLIDESP